MAAVVAVGRRDQRPVGLELAGPADRALVVQPGIEGCCGRARVARNGTARRVDHVPAIPRPLGTALGARFGPRGSPARGRCTGPSGAMPRLGAVRRDADPRLASEPHALPFGPLAQRAAGARRRSRCSPGGAPDRARGDFARPASRRHSQGGSSLRARQDTRMTTGYPPGRRAHGACDKSERDARAVPHACQAAGRDDGAPAEEVGVAQSKQTAADYIERAVREPPMTGGAPESERRDVAVPSAAISRPRQVRCQSVSPAGPCRDDAARHSRRHQPLERSRPMDVRDAPATDAAKGP